MKTLLAMLALPAIALLGCGGDNTSTKTTERAAESTAKSPSFGEELQEISMTELIDNGAYDGAVRYAAAPDGRLAYFITEASVSAGKIAFHFVNPQNTVHNVALEAPNGKTIGETETIGKGATTAHFTVKPGEYVLYCSVPGHRKAGMIGHLTVRPAT